MKIQALIILSLVFVMSCKSKKNTTSKMANENITSVLIAKGNLYGDGAEGLTKQNMVITNQNDWKALINKMNSVNNVSDNFTETEIDFNKSTIIAVFNDVKGSGGHQLELDISTTSEKTVVIVKPTSPTGMATSVMTQPYYIAKIQKTDLPIVFK